MYRQQAKGLLDASSQMETRRDEQNQMIKQANQAEKAQMAGMGAGIGFMAGAGATGSFATLGAAAGPVGMLIGAGVGLLASELF